MGLLAAWTQALGGVLLPKLCPLCLDGSPSTGGSFCPRCFAGLVPLREPFCSRCGVPFPGTGPSHPCTPCRLSPPAFDRVRAWGVYQGGLLSAVRGFKFEGRFALRRSLELLIVEAFDLFFGARRPGFDAVVPVPCHPTVLRRRGFDLPALLSRRLGRDRELPWRPTALAKVAETPDLVGLGAAERARAVARAYAPREPLEGAVLLVDDVVTTGATVRACARAARRAGAREVVVLALARTPLETR